MKSDEILSYWLNSAKEDYKTMKNLFSTKDYTWSLFLGHLVIEKILKGLYAKNNKENPYAPKSHDLVLLAKKCGLVLDDNKEKLLYTITTFNINARYEDYKNTFRNKCTREYAESQIQSIEEMREWLLELI